MATGFLAELNAFQQFLTNEIAKQSPQMSLEEALEESRARQRQIGEFKQDTEPSLEESAREDSEPLNIEDVVRRGQKRLAERGVTE